MSKLVLVLAVLAAALVIPEVAFADADFSDPAGDAGGAPDITDVFVANDSSGLLFFEVEVPSHETLDATSVLEIVIDTDLNADTGEAGWDYWLIVSADDWTLLRWDGTEWADAPSTTVEVFYSRRLSVFVSRSELGNTGGFNFFVGSHKVENDQVTASDVAPDGTAIWSYSVVPKTFGIAAGPLVRAPKIARAAKVFAVGFLVERTDWPFAADEAAVICTATLGGKKIAARQAFVAGVASCRVVLPKNAKGKKLKIVVRVLSGGQAVSRTYTATVK